jgi:hypothetical protein
MKRTLLALGILAGALMIATAPAQVVYSFEEPDMHGFADDDDPKTGWRVIQSSTIGVTHRNYSMGFFWPDEVSGFRWLISDGDPAKLAYLRISRKLLMDVTADATVPWTNMIVSLNGGYRDGDERTYGWRQTGFPVGLPREPGTRTVLLDLESLELPDPDIEWFQINFGLNAGATHRLYFDNMRLYRTACEMVAMTFDTDLHGFAPDPDDTDITVTWNSGKMGIESQGGFHWIFNGTVSGLAAMVRRGDLVVMDVTVVSPAPWANMILAINSSAGWGQGSYVADITFGGSGFTRALALDYRDASLPVDDNDYCLLNLGINSGSPITLEIDNIRIYRKAIAGDVNCDGCVDDADLLAVLLEFGSTAITPADVNGDGVVDDADLLEVLFNFGNGC